MNQANEPEAQRSTDKLHDELESLISDLAVADHHLGELRAALVAARQIGIAVGMIMGAGRMSENAALALLRRMGQTQNRHIREVADDIVQAGHVFI